MGDEAKMRKQSWQACKRHEGEDVDTQNGRGEEGGGRTNIRGRGRRKGQEEGEGSLQGG